MICWYSRQVSLPLPPFVYQRKYSIWRAIFPALCGWQFKRAVTVSHLHWIWSIDCLLDWEPLIKWFYANYTKKKDHFKSFGKQWLYIFLWKGMGYIWCQWRGYHPSLRSLVITSNLMKFVSLKDNFPRRYQNWQGLSTVEVIFSHVIHEILLYKLHRGN